MAAADSPSIPPVFPNVDAKVRLRRLERTDLDWLVGFDADELAVGAHNWAGPQAINELHERAERRLDRDGWIAPLDGQLVIEVLGTDGDGYVRAGTVGWRPRQWGPQRASTALVIGIAIHPDFRGRGVGTVTHQLLVDLLFHVTDVNRIEADTAIDNPAERRCLEKAGFHYEGTVRGAEFRDGRYVDHDLFGILRDDHQGGQKRPSAETDGCGTQPCSA